MPESKREIIANIPRLPQHIDRHRQQHPDQMFVIG
jgi:hypothetical protein